MVQGSLPAVHAERNDVRFQLANLAECGQLRSSEKSPDRYAEGYSARGSSSMMGSSLPRALHGTADRINGSRYQLAQQPGNAGLDAFTELR